MISGELSGASDPEESLTGNFMTTIDTDDGAHVAFDGLHQRNVFLYVVSGKVRINGRDISQHNLVEFDFAGDEGAIESVGKARLPFGHGDPIKEPVVAHAPFGMNTIDEIRQTITDYQAGKFGAAPA